MGIEAASKKANILLKNAQRQYALLIKKAKDNIQREKALREQYWGLADEQKKVVNSISEDEFPKEHADEMAKLKDLQLKSQMSTETIAEYQALLTEAGFMDKADGDE